MAKITFEENQKQEPTFPILRRHARDHHIVLFFDLTSGVVVRESVGSDNTYAQKGLFSNSWVTCRDLGMWEPVTGTVTFEID